MSVMRLHGVTINPPMSRINKVFFPQVNPWLKCILRIIFFQDFQENNVICCRRARSFLHCQCAEGESLRELECLFVMPGAELPLSRPFNSLMSLILTLISKV